MSRYEVTLVIEYYKKDSVKDISRKVIEKDYFDNYDCARDVYRITTNSCAETYGMVDIKDMRWSCILKDLTYEVVCACTKSR